MGEPPMVSAMSGNPPDGMYPPETAQLVGTLAAGLSKSGAMEVTSMDVMQC